MARHLFRKRSDEELISLARSTTNDRERDAALTQLFGRYLGAKQMPTWTRNALRTRLRSVSAQLVEDCVEIAAERLLREVLDAQRELPEPFEIAVRARCHYAALDATRSVITEGKRTAAIDAETAIERQRERRSIESEDPGIMSATNMDWEDLVGDLSSDEREMLHLRFEEDRPYDEIAEMLQATSATIRKRMERTLATLRAQIVAERAGVFGKLEMMGPQPGERPRWASPRGYLRARRLVRRVRRD